MQYTLYILYSATLDRYYLGYTSQSIEMRIKKHLSNHKGYTGISKDWQLSYLETYLSKEMAMKREKEIKNWKSKKGIEELIYGRNRASR